MSSDTLTRPTPIAVIIVCRNALAALQETVGSIREVSDGRILPIIIDGRSADGTAGYLQELRGWTHYAVTEPDEGIYDAMNKGWAAAPEDGYVMYLGAGDRLLRLPADEELRDPDRRPWPLVLGECSVGGRRFRSRWGWEMRLRNTAHHQALMLLKCVHPAPPFDVALRVYADWDFNLRLQRLRITARYHPGLRSYATPGGASWSMNLNEIRQVASRHGGALAGAVSYGLNGLSRWRRLRRDRATGAGL